jgi:hypothetical protein
VLMRLQQRNHCPFSSLLSDVSRTKKSSSCMYICKINCYKFVAKAPQNKKSHLAILWSRWISLDIQRLDGSQVDM